MSSDVPMAALPPLRGYQREMLDRAMNQDSVVYLETGMGKTRISVEAIFLALPAMRDAGQIAVFLAPSVPLVRQQAEVLSRVHLPAAAADAGTSQAVPPPSADRQGSAAPSALSPPAGAGAPSAPRAQGQDLEAEPPEGAAAPKRATPMGDRTLPFLQVKSLGGASVPEGWGLERWMQLVRQYDVLVCTPAVLLGAMVHALIRVHNIRLLVVDEVHHCREQHPYAVLMREFFAKPPQPLPPPQGTSEEGAQPTERTAGAQEPTAGGGGVGPTGPGAQEPTAGSGGVGPTGPGAQAAGLQPAPAGAAGAVATERPRVLGLTASPLEPISLEQALHGARLLTPADPASLAGCPSRPKARIVWVGPGRGAALVAQPHAPPTAGDPGLTFDPEQDKDQRAAQQLLERRQEHLVGALAFCRALLLLAEQVVAARERLQRLHHLGEFNWDVGVLAGECLPGDVRSALLASRDQFDASLKAVRLLKAQVSALEAALTDLGPWPALALAAADLFASLEDTTVASPAAAGGSQRLPSATTGGAAAAAATVSREELLHQQHEATDLGPPPTPADCQQLITNMVALHEAIESVKVFVLPAPAAAAGVGVGDGGGPASAVAPTAATQTAVGAEVSVASVLSASVSLGDRVATVVLALVMEGFLELMAPPVDEAVAISRGFGAALLHEGGAQTYGRALLTPWVRRLLCTVPAVELQRQVLGEPSTPPAPSLGTAPGGPSCGDGSGDGGSSGGGGVALPLVTYRVCWMLRQLRQRASAAAAAQAGVGVQGGGAGRTVSGRPWAAMVFCERKTTCEALSHLILSLPVLHGVLRAAVFVGTSGWATSLGKSRRRGSGQRRMDAVRRDFASGSLNLLLSTSVGAEGLDFSHCSLVVALDLPKHVTPFVQSGGRARAEGSEHWLLVSTSAEEAAAENLLRAEEQMVHLAQSLASANMSAVPPRGRYTDEGGFVEEEEGDPDADAVSAQDSDLGVGYSLEVPTTGARLPAVLAVDVLQQLCGQLPGNDGCTSLLPMFRWIRSGPAHGSAFSFRVFLPANLQMAPVDGPSCGSKVLAKKLACLETVRRLWQRGDLDDHLRLKYTRQAATRAAHAAAFGNFQHTIPQATLTHRLPTWLQPPPASQAPDCLTPPTELCATASDTNSSSPPTAVYHLYCFVLRPKQAEADPPAAWVEATRCAGRAAEDRTPFGGLLPWPLAAEAAGAATPSSQHGSVGAGTAGMAAEAAADVEMKDAAGAAADGDAAAGAGATDEGFEEEGVPGAAACCWGVLLHQELPVDLPAFELLMPVNKKGQLPVTARMVYLGPIASPPPLRSAFNALGSLLMALMTHPCPAAMVRQAAAAAATAAGKAMAPPKVSAADCATWVDVVGFGRLAAALATLAGPSSPAGARSPPAAAAAALHAPAAGAQEPVGGPDVCWWTAVPLRSLRGAGRGVGMAERLAAAAEAKAAGDGGGGGVAVRYIDWGLVSLLSRPPIGCETVHGPPTSSTTGSPSAPAKEEGAKGPDPCQSWFDPSKSLATLVARHGLIMSRRTYRMCGIREGALPQEIDAIGAAVARGTGPGGAAVVVPAGPAPGDAAAAAAAATLGDATALAAVAEVRPGVSEAGEVTTASGAAAQQSQPGPPENLLLSELSSYGRGIQDWLHSREAFKSTTSKGAAAAAAATTAKALTEPGAVTEAGNDDAIEQVRAVHSPTAVSAGAPQQTASEKNPSKPINGLAERKAKRPSHELEVFADGQPEAGRLAKRTPDSARNQSGAAHVVGPGATPAAVQQDSIMIDAARWCELANGGEDTPAGPSASPGVAGDTGSLSADSAADGPTVATVIATADALGPDGDVEVLPDGDSDASLAGAQDATPAAANADVKMAAEEPDGSGPGADEKKPRVPYARGRMLYREQLTLHMPELMAFYPLDLARWRMLHGLVCIMWRVEGLVSAAELLQERLRPLAFEVSGPQAEPVPVEQELLLAATAVTCPAARDPAFNNDRLEYLGDAVLKLLANLYVYLRERHVPTSHEGVLSFMRDSYVANEILATHALHPRLGVASVLRALSYEPVRGRRQARLAPDEDDEGRRLRPLGPYEMGPAVVAVPSKPAAAPGDAVGAAAAAVRGPAVGLPGSVGAAVGKASMEVERGVPGTTGGQQQQQQQAGASKKKKKNKQAAPQPGKPQKSAPPRKRPEIVTRVLTGVNGKRLADVIEALIGAHMLPSLEAATAAQQANGAAIVAASSGVPSEWQSLWGGAPTCTAAVQIALHDALCFCVGSGLLPLDSLEVIVTGLTEVATAPPAAAATGGAAAACPTAAAAAASAATAGAGPQSPRRRTSGAGDPGRNPWRNSLRRQRQPQRQSQSQTPQKGSQPLAGHESFKETREGQREQLMLERVAAAAAAALTLPNLTQLPVVLQCSVAAVEELLGYKFAFPALCAQALTHVSHPLASACGGGYQRIEFLGDAVLGMVVSLWAFRRGGTADEMSSLRRDLVSNGPLAAAAVRCQLHRHLRCGSASLAATIEAFAQEYQAALEKCGPSGTVVVSTADRLARNKRTERRQVQRVAAAKAAAAAEGDEDDDEEGDEELEEDDSSSSVLRAPKALADVLEALVGAVYLDGGGDLGTSERVVARLLLQS